MAGITDIQELIRGLTPKLNPGEYVFTTVVDVRGINRSDTVCEFRESEGTTLILERKRADELNLTYDYISSWITLSIHSSLDAVGLTAIFSGALAEHKISCNVVAGYYHDHIFVKARDAQQAMEVLKQLGNEPIK